jgi:hypothetical protein
MHKAQAAIVAWLKRQVLNAKGRVLSVKSREILRFAQGV